uniref:Carbonic anhydrase n=1 Tax=Chelonoidis abingdonii TaxID=106734 RepID=A0A8C0GZI5_CHEAB
GNMAQWGYDSDNGPEHWHKYYPIAKGDNQSPIEINSKEVHYEPSLLPWCVGYDPVGARTIVNNGRTCKVVFDDTFNRSVLRNGPLPGVYRLRQLHFHWGSSNDHGSEHIVDGVKYAGELHLVHWYSEYSNYAEALRNYDGVAILANLVSPLVLLKIFLFYLFKGKEAPFSNFDPSILFPKSWDYWTYHGSFTEPPCDECVTWILLREPIIVSPDQMAKLRSLSINADTEPARPMMDNWRPPQPRHFRMVRASFQ